MDKLLTAAIRRLQTEPTIDAAINYYHMIMRAGGTYALELSYLVPAASVLLTDEVRDAISDANAGTWLTHNGATTQSLAAQIESQGLSLIRECFRVDTDQPPVDFNPRLWYLGWDVLTEEPVAGNNSWLIAIWSTLRETELGVIIQFWYAVLTNNGEEVNFCTPWNINTAPQELPPTIETVEGNHSGIVHIFDLLDEARDEASEVWETYGEHVDAAEEAVCPECGDATSYTVAEGAQECGVAHDYDGCLHNLYQEIRDEADTYINNYTHDELDDMPNLSRSHFSNLKVDTGQIRVWLSRMKAADGMAFDYPVELEVWSPIARRWESYADFPSDPNEQDSSNVIWH